MHFLIKSFLSKKSCGGYPQTQSSEKTTKSTSFFFDFVIASIILGIASTTIIAKVGFLLGGLVFTAVNVQILLAASKLIYLFIEIEEDLSEIDTLLRKEEKN